MNLIQSFLLGAAIVYIIFKLEKMEELLRRLDNATNEIASDLEDLRNQLGNVLTEEQKARLDASITRLESLGADETNPIP